MERFDRFAATAAAQKQAIALHKRSVELALARVAAIGRQNEIRHFEEQVRLRLQSLEHFIRDPWAADSLLHLTCEEDRRLVLDAGYTRVREIKRSMPA